MLMQNNFEKILNHWHNREDIPSNTLADIYDGRIWNEFKDDSGNKFFIKETFEGRLGFSLNIDWFCPYKHVQYSVGAIYLSILNLPRELRYLKENIMFVGLIPGPHEPSVDYIYKYLEPLVEELRQLWFGKLFITRDYPIGKIYKGVLILVSCDIPAGRKV